MVHLQEGLSNEYLVSECYLYIAKYANHGFSLEGTNIYMAVSYLI